MFIILSYFIPKLKNNISSKFQEGADVVHRQSLGNFFCIVFFSEKFELFFVKTLSFLVNLFYVRFYKLQNRDS